MAKRHVTPQRLKRRILVSRESATPIGKDARVRRFKDGWKVEDSGGGFIAFRRSRSDALSIAGQRNSAAKKDRSHQPTVEIHSRPKDKDFSRESALMVRFPDPYRCECHGVGHQVCPFN